MRSLVSLLIAFVLLTCLNTTASFSEQTITIDLDNERQSIQANGINFEGYHRVGGNEVLKSSLREMLQKLNTQMVRFGMPLQEFEPENDDNDPKHFNWNNFNDNGGAHNAFLRLQDMEDRNLDVWLAIWDVADWLVSNPGSGAQRKINDMDEFVEAVCAFLLRAQNEYGVAPKYVSVNEPSIARENGWGGYDIALTAEEQATIIKKAGKRFEELGITTRWILAVHKVYPSELEYAQHVYNDNEAQQYIAALDFHGYWFQDGHDAQLKAWGDWVATLDVPVFCGECDYDNQFWKRDDRYEWRSHSRETGKLLNKMYNLARASGTLLWYADAPNANRPFRFVNKHFYEYLIPGAKIVDSESSSSDILITAAKHVQKDKLVLIVQNVSNSEKTVTISGLPDGELHWIKSFNGHYYQTADTQPVSDGSMTVMLEPNSIHTFHGAGGSMPFVKFTANPQTSPPPVEVTFDASESFDPQGHELVKYEWDFGDGSTQTTTNPMVTHRFTKKGVYKVILTVTNSENESRSSFLKIYISEHAQINSTGDVPAVDGKKDSTWIDAFKNKIKNILSGNVTDTLDLSAQFQTFYTMGNLYFIVQVKDDVLENDAAKPEQNDSIELLLDVGNDKSESFERNDFYYTFSIDSANFDERRHRTESIVYEVNTDENGYTMEIAVPWNILQTEPENGLYLGLELKVNDYDNSPDKEAVLAWNASSDWQSDSPLTFGVAELIEVSSSLPNRLPNVEITEPSEGTSYFEGDDVSIVAQASDPDGQIAKIEFYQSGQLIGNDDNGSDGWNVIWKHVAVGNYEIFAKAFDDDGESKISASVPVFVYKANIPVALFVSTTSNPGGGDADVIDRLKNKLGFQVVVQPAGQTTANDATGKAVVLISETVSSGQVADKFKNAAVPVISWEPWVYDDMQMTGKTSNTDYGKYDGQSLTIMDESHEMSAGLSGDVQVATSNTTMSWGKPSTNAFVIGVFNADPDQAAIFAYEKGAEMAGLKAPARRIGFFWQGGTPSLTTDEGWMLFDAAVNWATDETADIESQIDQYPQKFTLEQNYPNPFNPTTTICYDLPKPTRVTLAIYNLKGQRIKKLIDRKLSAGKHQIRWDGTDSSGRRVASGIYIYEIYAGENRQSRRMLLLR